MSQPPPTDDPAGQPQEPFAYYSPPQDNAPRLIRLAVIFNYLSVGIDVLTCLLCVGVGVLFLVVPELADPGPSDPPGWVMSTMYMALGLIALIFAGFKALGTRRLQTGGPHAWGWGLTVGILGCCQLLCGSCCMLQVAPGVYTVVILSFDHVKRYLADRPVQAASENG